MPQYRKKPIVVDAHCWFGEPGGLPEWARSHENLLIETDGEGKFTGYLIETLEGDMRVSPGDWIIRGVKGEIYPCKPDIFAATYEPVSP
jgi:hypothetical protein